MSELENITPHSGEIIPAHAPSGVIKSLLWTLVVLGGVYILNPTAGFDLLPDNLPILGNLDEAAILLLMLGALRYMGVGLPDFVERLIQPAGRLPPAVVGAARHCWRFRRLSMRLSIPWPR